MPNYSIIPDEIKYFRPKDFVDEEVRWMNAQKNGLPYAEPSSYSMDYSPSIVKNYEAQPSYDSPETREDLVGYYGVRNRIPPRYMSVGPQEQHPSQSLKDAFAAKVAPYGKYLDMPIGQAIDNLRNYNTRNAYAMADDFYDNNIEAMRKLDISRDANRDDAMWAMDAANGAGAVVPKANWMPRALGKLPNGRYGATDAKVFSNPTARENIMESAIEAYNRGEKALDDFLQRCVINGTLHPSEVRDIVTGVLDGVNNAKGVKGVDRIRKSYDNLSRMELTPNKSYSNFWNRNKK